MALRAGLLLKSWAPALRRVFISTSPVVQSGGVAQLSRDGSAFVQLMKKDGFMVVALITGISVFGYTRYNVSMPIVALADPK